VPLYALHYVLRVREGAFRTVISGAPFVVLPAAMRNGIWATDIYKINFYYGPGEYERRFMRISEILIATTNEGKVREICEILSDYSVRLTTLKNHWETLPHIPETGATFLENARMKAQWVFSKKGLWTMADDSGLEVDALNGAPGILSARYAGPDANPERNNNLLLKNLNGLEPARRTARFRCVVVLLGPETMISADGTCEGRIGFESQGDRGFGYDPLFIPNGFTETFAQLDSAQKHQISHRGRALQLLKGKIHELF
jgi:XTP/dITP diphosphohydrolase